MCWMLTAVMTLMPASSRSSTSSIPLLVGRSGRVGVRELVDDGDLRPPRLDRLDVHLLERHAAVLDRAQRHLLEVADQRQRVGAAVRLDEADDDVEPLAFQLVGVLEHLVASCRRRAPRRCTRAAARALLPWRAPAATRRPTAASSGIRTLFLHRMLVVEREVELQDVDDRLAEEAELPPFDVCASTRRRTSASGMPRSRATRGTWNVGRGRRDVRIEAGRRRGHEVDRHRRRPGSPAAPRRRRPSPRRSASCSSGRGSCRPNWRRRSRCRPPTAATGSSPATRTPGR